jgi:hypothetical protein
MFSLDPYRFQLVIGGRTNKRRLLHKKQYGKEVKFRKPVTTQGLPKIYILKKGEDILYVGFTQQSIGARLSGGMYASGSYGYHGYKWKQDYDEVDLLVFVGDETFNVIPDHDAQVKLKYEAIEAELVYLIRERTKRWPEYQNEIHFNNVDLDDAKKVAGKVYNVLNPSQ